MAAGLPERFYENGQSVVSVLPATFPATVFDRGLWPTAPDVPPVNVNHASATPTRLKAAARRNTAPNPPASLSRDAVRCKVNSKIVEEIGKLQG